MLSKVVAGVPFFPIKLGEVPYNSKRWEESNFIPCNGKSPILIPCSGVESPILFQVVGGDIIPCSGGRSPILSQAMGGVPSYPGRWEESHLIPCSGGGSSMLSHVVGGVQYYPKW